MGWVLGPALGLPMGYRPLNSPLGFLALPFVLPPFLSLILKVYFIILNDSESITSYLSTLYLNI